MARTSSSSIRTQAERENLQWRANEAIGRATEFLMACQREDHHWCAELESNATITAEYVFLRQLLGLGFGSRTDRIARYLMKQQNHNGSWGIARHWDGDVSTSVEVYLALRILGVSPLHPTLLSAERYIRLQGGVRKVRVFTRIFLAMFGLIPWSSVPGLPAEFMLLSTQAPVNVYSLSSWARGTTVPLLVIYHHKPIYGLPNGRMKNNPWLDHLWLDPTRKNVPSSDAAGESWISWLDPRPSWKKLFGTAEFLFRIYETRKIHALRRRALDACINWIIERQEPTGDWAGIFPPMINSVIALTLEGFDVDSDPVKRGLQAIEKFSWEDADGLRIQACTSPVWDTVLSVIGLVDSGFPQKSPEMEGAVKWVLEKQVLTDRGDWKVGCPGLAPGGWSFEYVNSWYPDVDDTAAVLLALLKQDLNSVHSPPIKRGLNWLLGMQNSDGGWAAFDVDNDNQFLNEISFSDMESLCDPSSPDVTGRVLEVFGLWLEEHKVLSESPELAAPMEMACRRGVEYLRRTQEMEGSWFGRWGVNYIYGTSNVLCGISRLGLTRHDSMVQRALEWLKDVQNPDGGWGESLASYSDRKWMGKGTSTPSQTAWAILGLLGFLPASDPSILRGIRWLVDHQADAEPEWALEGGIPVPEARGGTWVETQFTGTGFPNHFYLRYNLYRHYFPLMALGRFIQARQAQE